MRLEEKIEQQQKKIEQAKARLAQMQSKASGEKRKRETREKVLLGALMIQMLEQSEQLRRVAAERAESFFADKDRAVVSRFFVQLDSEQHDS